MPIINRYIFHLPAVFFAFSLAIALNVQTYQTPLAGAWLLFHIASCMMMAYCYHDLSKGAVWWSCLAWLCMLGTSAFLLAPVANGAATMWNLASLPILALTMRKEYLKSFLIAALAVVTVYAVGLIIQMLLHVQYTNYNYPIWFRGSPAVAWPLLDPNNAAAIVNMGLIPCFYLAMRDKRWFALVGIFSFALFATASKMGAIAGSVACIILLAHRFRCTISTALIFIFAAVLGVMEAAGNSAFQYSLSTRLMIWKASWPLLFISPIGGLGLGTFPYYYAQVRPPEDTANGGFFAHNDLLQLAIEMGWPAACVFVAMMVVVFVKTTGKNIVAMCAMLAIVMQSMSEFQFYLPSVSLLMGLAMSYHLISEHDYE